MPVQIHLNGQRYFADDGTDPAELQQLAQMHQEEQRQLNPINQGMQNVFSGINRDIQNYNELPAPTVVPGNTYGMSTQAFNQTAGIIQQDNMNSATARMQQRVQMEQAMEQEKDRAQQIKVQDMQFKNQQKLEKMKLDQEEARLKREARTTKPITLPGGGVAEYTPGVDGQPGTINTLLEPTPKIMPQQFVKTMDAQGNPVMRIATPEELRSGVPLYEKPEGGAGFTLSPGQSRFDAQGNPLAEVPANEQSKSLTPTQTLDLELKAIRLVKEQRKDWFDNDRYSDTFGQVKPEFAMQFEAEVSRRVQAATAGGTAPTSPQGGALAASAPVQGGGVPANPPMAREGFVNGKPALINDATGEYVLMDDAASPPSVPPVVPQGSAPISSTKPPNVQTSFDVMNPSFTMQNGNPYLGPVAYPAPNAVPGALSRSNYVAPQPRSLEEVVADANALKIRLAQERNANLPPVNNGQSLADLVNSGYIPPPPAPPREMDATEKWMIATGQAITREADAALRSGLTALASLHRGGKNNVVFDNVAKRLLDNNVPIPVVRERFSQYPGVMRAVEAEYHKRTGRMLPIDY